MGIIKQFFYIINSKQEHFLYVDYSFYKKWKLIIKMLTFFNKDYRSCEIYRKRFKILNDIVIIGLKWNGKKVKRRTTGFAKEFLEDHKNPKCIYCERKLNPTNATTDHIVPISKGGNNTQVNLIVSCLNCNSERGYMDFYKYLKMKNPKFKNTRDIFI